MCNYGPSANIWKDPVYDIADTTCVHVLTVTRRKGCVQPTQGMAAGQDGPSGGPVVNLVEVE